VLTPADRAALGRLVGERGLLLTYATARSFRRTAPVVGTEIWRVPVIVHNGAFSVHPRSGRPRRTHLLAPEAVAAAIVAATRHGLCPAVFSLRDGLDRVQWVRGHETPALGRFLADRPGDPRFAPVGSPDELATHGVFAIAVMDTPGPVAAVVADLDAAGAAPGRTVSQDAHHPEDTWLEIGAPDASKAGEALALRDELGADRLVCFGDNHNDLSLFAVADESYAVANAAAAVRAAATAVIRSNAESGVVRWLEEHT
jgi:hydroxymethylpyrimidine pyrophosphatase-like HAD family hydrolase